MAREDERLNRTFWETTSAEYQTEHADELEAAPLAWGTWRIPESEVGALGDLARARRARARLRWRAVVDRARAARRARRRPRPVSRAAQPRGEQGRACAVRASERGGSAVRGRVVRRRVLRSRGDDVRRSRRERARGRTVASAPAADSSSATRQRCESCASTRTGRHYDAASHRVRHEARHRRRIGRLRAPPRRVDPPLPPTRPRRRRPHRAAAAAGATTTYPWFASYEWASQWPAEEIWIARKT